MEKLKSVINVIALAFMILVMATTLIPQDMTQRVIKVENYPPMRNGQ